MFGSSLLRQSKWPRGQSLLKQGLQSTLVCTILSFSVRGGVYLGELEP